MKTLPTLFLFLLFLPAPVGPVAALARQQTGSITGHVTLSGTGEPLHGARVLLIDLGRSTLTDESGAYRFDGVPPGVYELLAVREHLQAARASASVRGDKTAELNFSLALSAVHEEVTVTATGRETTAFDAFNTVDVIDSVDLAQNMASNLGELLEGQPNVAKRSFGPGSSRPVIRGFDNDRVLVMQDGIRTGDLSSQSGDHGVSIDPGSLEKVEILKGPATLLYGSSAVGGVVNTITPQQQFYARPPRELRGQITTDFGSTNDQAGGNANFQYGSGRFMAWFGGGARRTSDYGTPLGPVPNSQSNANNGRLGLGWFGDRAWLSVGYQIEDGVYGVPFAGSFEFERGRGEPPAPLIDLDTRRQNVRLDAGIRQLPNGPVRSVKSSITFIDWHHDEVEKEPDGARVVGTSFDNRTWIGRIEAEQTSFGRVSGRFGIWTQWRDYVPSGEEALSPPVVHRSAAGFVYEQLKLDGAELQLGARIEHNGYGPEPRTEITGSGLAPVSVRSRLAPDSVIEPQPTAPRSFTGLSASFGVRIPFAQGKAAIVANFTSSYRAPALEELYNFGPHVGNLAFEIGGPLLRRERSTGGEMSLRWNARRTHGNLNFFLYDIDDFIFSAPTGAIREGMPEVRFLQANARYLGLDATFQVHLHPELELVLSGGWVRAELTDSNEPVPRIPPASGRLALEWTPLERLHVRPGLVVTSRQDRVFGAETPTDGYALASLLLSYMIARAETMHVITLNFTNLGDRPYRNHNSLIKDLAPEAGRRVLLTYALRIF